MSNSGWDFALQTAVEVYGAFLTECVECYVSQDRTGPPPKSAPNRIDGRPVRLVTISGKGGWSPEPGLASNWAASHNISLLDHLLSVVRGGLMFYLADAPRPWFQETDFTQVQILAHALAAVGFLHDIDKDLGLARNAIIDVTSVAERMSRYGIGKFLERHGSSMSAAAMLNYIEEVEGTQAGRSAAAADFDKQIAATCRFIALADRLDSAFASTRADAESGVAGVLSLLQSWPHFHHMALRKWSVLEMQDPIHPFLLDCWQSVLAEATERATGWLPLIELVHDGALLCLVPCADPNPIISLAKEQLPYRLPYGLRFSVNNRLACQFAGGRPSWEACLRLLDPESGWNRDFENLLALPRAYVQQHFAQLNDLFRQAGIETSWSPIAKGSGATVKPLWNYESVGDPTDWNACQSNVHALCVLVALLNHRDVSKASSPPPATQREQELVQLLAEMGLALPLLCEHITDGRARRVVLAVGAVGTIVGLRQQHPDQAEELENAIWSPMGLAGLWLLGTGKRPGLADLIPDESRNMLIALRARFTSMMSRHSSVRAEGALSKHCILCNEPVAADQKVASTSHVHGIKVSAFSGRTGRHDHLSQDTGDTHLCLVCRAELQFRDKAQQESRVGRQGDLPPLITSPVTTGLFGGLAFTKDNTEKAMNLFDLNRLDIRKGTVYLGLDCQHGRIRMARLETLPRKDVDLVAFLRRALTAVQRTGRPLHIFSGAARRHPAIFYYDAMPGWLALLLGGDSLRLEQLSEAISKLDIYLAVANTPGLGIEWARQLADPRVDFQLGAVCVVWATAVDRRDDKTRAHALTHLRIKMQEEALKLISVQGDTDMGIACNQDPLVRLACLVARIQRRCTTQSSTSQQLLCWNTALTCLLDLRALTQDREALVLGIASTLEEELKRKQQAAAAKHRDGQALADGCMVAARHFTEHVWVQVFKETEPSSQAQRRAAAVYRFALLESYKQRENAADIAEGTPTGT